jgi:hypothetical protein
MTCILAVVLVLAAEDRRVGTRRDGGEQPLVVRPHAVRRLRRMNLLQGLAHRLAGGEAANALHGRADVGDGAVERHRPDDVPGVLGEQAVALLGLLQFDLGLM